MDAAAYRGRPGARPAAAVAQILGVDGAVAGAGFLVGQSLLVTCAHVVAAAGGGPDERIQLAFPQAPLAPLAQGVVLAESWRAPEGQDIAFVRVDRVVDDAEPLVLGSAAGCRGHRVRSFGFPRQAPPGGHFGSGTAGDLLDTASAGMLLQLTGANDLTTGFSGGPVIDEITGRVIGMLNSITAPDDLHRGAEIAYATPTEVLREVRPELGAREISPYRELEAFTVQDAEWFHGRGAAVQLVVNSLAEHRGALLLGPSGSGKSSLVQAGVLPALARSKLPGSHRWLPVLVARPGRDLPAELERVLPGAGTGGLAAAARNRLAAEPGYERILLVIDQLEELLASPDTGGQAQDDLLAAAVKQITAVLRAHAPISVVLVMRDDFYPRLAALAPQLLEAAPRPVNVPATLSEQDLHDIITLPAQAAGARFEDGLPERIITDLLAGGHTGTTAGYAPVTLLPPLELVLSQMWEHCQNGGDGMLTHQAYQALGRVTGSLASWCNTALDQLPAGKRPIAERILTALVRPADDIRQIPAVRQQVPQDTLRAIAARSPHPASADTRSGRDFDDALAALTSHRIITTHTEHVARQLGASGAEPAAEPVAELIHDTLIRDWPELRGWVARDHRFHDWLRRATEQHLRWNRFRNRNDLLRGTDLAEGLDWRRQRALPPEIAEFLTAGQEAVRARTRRARRAIRVLATLTVLFLAAAAIAWAAVRRAQREEAAVRAETAVAVSRQLAAEALSLDPADPYTARQLAAAAWTVSGTVQASRTEAALLNEQSGTIITPDREIHSVAFSPDGTTVATAGRDGKVRLWNPATGQQVGTTITATSNGAAVSNVVFTHDGALLATAGGDNGQVRLWTTSTHRQAGNTITATGNGTPVLGLAFDPSGTLLATAGGDGSVRLWSPSTQHQVGTTITATGNGAAASGVAFSPDGTLLAIGDANGGVRLWNPATQQAGITIPAAGNVATNMTFDPDGKLATAGGDGSVRLWNPATGHQVGNPIQATTVSGALGMTFSPNGALLATAGGDGTVRLWNPSTRKQVGSTITANSNKSIIWGLSFNPAGTLLATADNGTVRLWNTATQTLAGSSITATSNGSAVTDIAFSPSGTVLATGGGDGTVRLWNPATREQAGPAIPTPAAVAELAFSPSGTLLATAGGDGMVRLWNPDTRQQAGTIPATTSGGLTSVAFDRSGTVLAAGDDSGSVRLWDPVTHRQLGTTITATSNGSGVTSLAFSPSGTLLATAGNDGMVRLWNPATGQQAGPAIATPAAVAELAFSPSGTLLATAGGDGMVRLWNPATGQQAGPTITAATSKSIVWDVAFNPSGTILAVASADGSVRLWNPATGQPLGAGGNTAANDGGAVLKVAFNPQGTVLATANGDGSSTLIDVSQQMNPHRYLCDEYGLPPAPVWTEYTGASITEPAAC